MRKNVASIAGLQNSKSRRGFTGVELSAVTSVLMLLIALLLPAVQQSREAARRTRCKNNLKQLGLAMHNYHDVHNGFPARRIGPGVPADGLLQNRLSAHVAVLPYLDQAPLFNQINFTNPKTTDSITGSTSNLWNTPLLAFVCPTDGTLHKSPTGVKQAYNNYVYNTGDGAVDDGTDATSKKVTVTTCRGLFGSNSCVRYRDVTDGLSNTIMMAEAVRPETSLSLGMKSSHAATIPADVDKGFDSQKKTFDADGLPANETPFGYRWADGAGFYNGFTTAVRINAPSAFIVKEPTTWSPGLFAASSKHVGGCHVLMADGAVRFVSQNINTGDNTAALPTPESKDEESPYGTWGKLGTKAGGETLGEF